MDTPFVRWYRATGRPVLRRAVLVIQQGLSAPEEECMCPARDEACHRAGAGGARRAGARARRPEGRGVRFDFFGPPQ